MKFGMKHAPGAGSVTILLTCSPVCYHCATTAPAMNLQTFDMKLIFKQWKIWIFRFFSLSVMLKTYKYSMKLASCLKSYHKRIKFPQNYDCINLSGYFDIILICTSTNHFTLLMIQRYWLSFTPLLNQRHTKICVYDMYNETVSTITFINSVTWSWNMMNRKWKNH